MFQTCDLAGISRARNILSYDEGQYRKKGKKNEKPKRNHIRFNS